MTRKASAVKITIRTANIVKMEKKGGYCNTKKGYRSREDYSGFEDCDKGKILRNDNDTEICTNHYAK